MLYYRSRAGRLDKSNAANVTMQRSIRSPAGSHCHGRSMSTSPGSASQKQESTSEAAQITCPRRHVDGITRIERVNGEKLTWWQRILVSWAFSCVWLPFALDTWKDVRYHRSHYGALLAIVYPKDQMQFRNSSSWLREHISRLETWTWWGGFLFKYLLVSLLFLNAFRGLRLHVAIHWLPDCYNGCGENKH
jgi:LITAF-like zinc ribbon domain